MNYYVRVGEQNQGPFSADELLSRGLLRSESYVWAEGMNDWQPAHQVPELARRLAAAAQAAAQQTQASLNPYASSVPGADWNQERRLERLPHSGLGITSTILGGLSIAMSCIAMVSIISLVVDDPNAMEAMDEESPLLIGIGLFICGSGLLSILGLILGVVGMLLPERRKFFAYLGVGLSSLILFCGGSLMLLGTIAG